MSEVSRRKFIQLSVIGGAVAATGCHPQSRYNDRIYKSEALGQYGGYDDRALPYLTQPDGYQDGVPQYFATVCQMCPAGCGLFVRTMGGRAHNAQGSPDHPVSGGKICSRGVASLQHLYEPGRLRFPSVRSARGTKTTMTNWEDALTRTVSGLQATKGRIAILADQMTIGRMPTLSKMIGQFAKSSGATVYGYSLLDDAPWRAAAKAVYGKDQLPAYRLDEADFILAFSSNFLEAWPSPVYYSRLFGEFRQGPRRKQGEHGRFVYVGPRMSMTAAKADLWLPCNPGTEWAVAQALLSYMEQGGIPIDQAAKISGISEKQLLAVADDFAKTASRSVALGGDGLLSQTNGTAAMIGIEALNNATGSQCVSFGQAALTPSTLGTGSSYRQVKQLTTDMQAGRIGALLILGQPNPVFTLPSATGFAEALAKVPFVAAMTPYEDETTDHADVMLPTRTFLEDWGDDIPAVIPPGTRMATLRQPVIDPQFVTTSPGLEPANYASDIVPWMDTRPTGDLLIDLSKRLGKPLLYGDTRDAVRHTWAGLKQADLAAPSTGNDAAWVAALSKGGYWTETAAAPAVGHMPTASPSVSTSVSPHIVGEVTEDATPISGNVKDTNIIESDGTGPYDFTLHLFPHIYWTDGRHSNLGWMQECADPMTSAVWNNWVEINLDVAKSLHIRTGDIIRLTTPHGSIEVPAVPSPGIHPGVVAMPIGQGHTRYGREDMRQGSNPLSILEPTAEAQTGALAYNATSVQVVKVRSAKDGYHPELNTLVLTQDRPGGSEPEAVQDLIHTTAKEWKTAKPVEGAPQAAESIFNRDPGRLPSPTEKK
jgi:anaerobic selenocysteine-containing dehydrogenase